MQACASSCLSLRGICRTISISDVVTANGPASALRRYRFTTLRDSAFITSAKTGLKPAKPGEQFIKPVSFCCHIWTHFCHVFCFLYHTLDHIKAGSKGFVLGFTAVWSNPPILSRFNLRLHAIVQFILMFGHNVVPK